MFIYIYKDKFNYKMDGHRLARKNKIMNDIRDAEVCINRNNDTIKRIKNSLMGKEYVMNQITKLKNSIEEKNELLLKLNEDVKNVLTGCLDEDIENEYKISELKIKQQRSVRDKQIEEKNNDKKETIKISQNYWQSVLNENRSQKQNERDYNYGKKYFYKVLDTLPSYIIKNLSEMPNNKGYIWRGIHFYGDLPEEKGPRVMFEKKSGGILVIHEHTNDDYKIYEKDGKNRKHLVQIQHKKRC